MEEELQFEIEALQLTYGEEQISLIHTDENKIEAVKLDLQPRYLEAHEIYVCLRLRVDIPVDNYPEQSVSVSVADSKGRFTLQRIDSHYMIFCL